MTILGLHNITEMVHRESANMFYKALDIQVPICLITLLNIVSYLTNTSLRNSELNIRSLRLKRKNEESCFAFQGAMVWNSLSNDCKTVIVCKNVR